MRISDWSSDVCSSDLSIKVDPATAAIAVVLPEPTVNAAWAQSGGNASKSMGHPALGATRAKLWEASIAGSTNKHRTASSAVVADNPLFLVDTHDRGRTLCRERVS